MFKIFGRCLTLSSPLWTPPFVQVFRKFVQNLCGKPVKKRKCLKTSTSDLHLSGLLDRWVKQSPFTKDS